MATIAMIYNDEKHNDLKRLVEDFGKKVGKLGVVLKTIDFKDD